jgi:hypothetical protein
VRFGLLSADFAAGAFFLLSGVFTCVLFSYQHPCQVAGAATNITMVVVFVLKPAAFMQMFILQSPRSLLLAKRKSNVTIVPSGLRFKPVVLYF